jgi:beta-phosphoglucomutase family hydrolase
MHNAQIALSKYKAAIFDMDGTMINNMAYHQKAWQAFLKKHGVTLTEDEFRHKISGKKNDQIFEIVFGKKLSTENLAEYTEEKEQLYRDIYKPDIKEVKGLKNTIDTLRQHGIKLAIATTAPKKNRDFGLHELGLENEFETILGDEHVTNGKPHPEIYLSTAKQLGVTPNECIVFEDTPPGVASGKDAGMTVVGILTSHTPEELERADFAVDDFTHIEFI